MSESISAFVRQCRKSFITISGGGDPLYKFDVHKATLLSMAETIKREGYKVRVITREVQHVGELKGIADHVSISLDGDVLQSLVKYRDQWAAVSCLALMSACSSMLPKPQFIRFSSDKGELTIEKVGCVIQRGQFTDRSGNGNARPFFKGIAVTEGGATAGQWYASCQAVIPNGTSTCHINGPMKASFECSNYDRFMITN